MRILRLIVAGALALAGLQAKAQQTIEIGLLTTTHVLFTSDLTYVDISSPDKIVAKVVDASKNMLAIKAKDEFAFTTTVSALEANGTMHTFYVKYNPNPAQLLIDTRVQNQSNTAVVNTQIRPEELSSGTQAGQGQQAVLPPSDGGASKGKKDKDRGSSRSSSSSSSSPTPVAPANGVTITGDQTSNFGRANAPTLEEVMRKGQEIYHVTDKSYRLEAEVINVYAYSDLTYVVIRVVNNSDIGYEAGDAQFTVESRKNSRQLTTDKSVWPKSSYGTLSCAPNSRTMVGYTLPKQTLQKNEVLKIYIYEKGGTRNLFLTLDDKDVNYAVSPI